MFVTIWVSIPNKKSGPQNSAWRKAKAVRAYGREMVYLMATLSSRCGGSRPRVGQYSDLPSLVNHVDAPFGKLSRNLVTSQVGETLIIIITLTIYNEPIDAFEKF